MGSGMRRNQSDCVILFTWPFSTNQMAGFSAQVSGYWQVNGEVWIRVRPNMRARLSPEVTSSKLEVTLSNRKLRHRKPEVTGNLRETTWLDKNTLLFNVLGWILGSREELAEAPWCKDDLRDDTLETSLRSLGSILSSIGLKRNLYLTNERHSRTDTGIVRLISL